jgi:hypothetical protein
MILILFIRNLLLLTYNIVNLINILTTKSLKKILLFILFYLLINLYLLPTFALCEIDLNLIDRENNTYRGSKIVRETPEVIVTQADLDLIVKICDAIIIMSALGCITILSLHFYYR